MSPRTSAASPTKILYIALPLILAMAAPGFGQAD